MMASQSIDSAKMWPPQKTVKAREELMESSSDQQQRMATRPPEGEFQYSDRLDWVVVPPPMVQISLTVLQMVLT
jgi:hypothetical protein